MIENNDFVESEMGYLESSSTPIAVQFTKLFTTS